jgi:hypothetical protein
MRTIGTFLLVLGIFATAAWTKPAAGQDKEKKRKGKITIGKETTYITGPLDEDGYVDYVTALNERLSKGVTPENNANVLIWKSLGPRSDGKPVPAEYFRRMGVAAPPERGDCCTDLLEYLKAQKKNEPGEEPKEIVDKLLERLRQRPWTAKDHPHAAAWLKANAKPLSLAVAASRRTHFYSPVIPLRTKKVPPGLFTTPTPGLNEYRRLTDALTARAMLRVGQGKYDDAWQDLLACHRLGRLVARGGTDILFLVGVSIEGIASEADRAFLERSKPAAKQIARYLGDLQKLPAFPALADNTDLAGRYAFLELLTMIDHHGASFLEVLGGEGGKDDAFFTGLMLQNVDWDPALREANKWFDRLAAASREPDHAIRRRKLREFDIDVKLLKNKVAQWGGVTSFLGGKQARGKTFGDTMLCLLFPALLKVQEAADRTRQGQDNLTLAFALEWSRREQGRYPKTLAALAPKYLKDVPRDAFTGDALLYRPSAKGYLLYGVGANGRDDGGRGYDDDPPGDDVIVRTPLPPLRRK